MNNDNLIFMIHHLAFLLMRQSDQALQEGLGIGFSQFKLLKVLSHNPHIKQKQIAAELGQTEASISRQIKLMHDDGLLATAISPNNRRQHITTLTAKGERYAKKAHKVLLRQHQPLANSLSTQQKKQLSEILLQMHGSACDSNQQFCGKLNINETSND